MAQSEEMDLRNSGSQVECSRHSLGLTIITRHPAAIIVASISWHLIEAVTFPRKGDRSPISTEGEAVESKRPAAACTD